MSKVKQLKSAEFPFFISLDVGYLQLMGGNLDKNRFKVSSLAYSKLPLDALQKGEIVQKELLGGMIRKLMASGQPKSIKSNFICLNIPDEFVFSKFLTLPEIKSDELEATVFFKIKDFLPYKAEELYLDWQVLKDGSNNLELSVVAVKRSILDSYLGVFKIANIFPQAFEPESFSLARLATFGTLDPCLIIYFNTHKVSFCFAQRGVVLLNTTLNYHESGVSEQEIFDQLSKSAKYWQASFGNKKLIKKVFFGGLIRNELMLKSLVKEHFGLQLEKLPLPVIVPPNMSLDQTVRLTPLFGLSFSPMLSSERGKKITLIPKDLREKRKAYGFKKRFKGLLKATILFLWGFVALYAFFSWSSYFNLEKTKAALSGWEKIVFRPRQMLLEKEAALFNQKVAIIEGVQGKRTKISPKLRSFIKEIPPGIVISSFNFVSSNNSFKIEGQANSREDLLFLEKSLSKMGEVNIPLSSFEQSDQPKFTLTLELRN